MPYLTVSFVLHLLEYHTLNCASLSILLWAWNYCEKWKEKKKKKKSTPLFPKFLCPALGLVISWTITCRLWRARARQTKHSSRIITHPGWWKSATVTGLQAAAVKEHRLLQEMSQRDCDTSQSLEGHGEVISEGNRSSKGQASQRKFRKKKNVKLLPWQQRKVHGRGGWPIRSERKGKAQLWKNGFVSWGVSAFKHFMQPQYDHSMTLFSPLGALQGLGPL